MAFADFPGQAQVVQLLQRGLERGRLAHAYLFTGHQLAELGAIARTLAKTLNCQNPVRKGGRVVDCCDKCATCKKIESNLHPDVQWVRPESKSRVITVDEMRELMREIHLKPNEAEFKVAVIEAADRLNEKAANAFLKTLEEPPAKSILILLTTEPQRILETILSRCLRLNFAGDAAAIAPAQKAWLAEFAEMAAAEQKSLIGRYRLLGSLLKRLEVLKGEIEESMAARSPLEHYKDVDKDLREKWEDEQAAAAEAEYRLQRSDLLLTVQRWMRDVWLHTMSMGNGLLDFPDMPSAGTLAKRISSSQAAENLRILESTQRLLGSNVQEALALEVSFLKLNL